MCLHKTTHKHATSEEVFAINPIVASVATFLHFYCNFTCMLLTLFLSSSALLSSRREKNNNKMKRNVSCQKGSQHNSCIINTSEIFFLLSCFLFSRKKTQRSCECSQMTFMQLKEVYSTWRERSVSVIAYVLSCDDKGSNTLVKHSLL